MNKMSHRSFGSVMSAAMPAIFLGLMSSAAAGESVTAQAVSSASLLTVR